jgi:hypothetical protein
MPVKLQGKTVLLLQATSLVSIDLQQMLEEEGARVIITSDHADASRADLLLVDHDGAGNKVASHVHANGTPMVIYSGSVDGLTQQFPQAVIVNKPAPIASLLKAIDQAFRRRR